MYLCISLYIYMFIHIHPRCAQGASRAPAESRIECIVAAVTCALSESGPPVPAFYRTISCLSMDEQLNSGAKALHALSFSCFGIGRVPGRIQRGEIEKGERETPGEKPLELRPGCRPRTWCRGWSLGFRTRGLGFRIQGFRFSRLRLARHTVDSTGFVRPNLNVT